MRTYTKDELYNLIKTSPNEFNEWKSTQKEVDLSELNFSYLKLDRVDLSGADLSGSSFADSHLTAVDFSNTDLMSVEFTRAIILECDFSESILTGANYSYATVHYCNFADADMAGGVFLEADLSNSDFAGTYNLNACQFDDSTIWPESEMLPEDFDSSYHDDLSSLKDYDDTGMLDQY